MAARNDKVNGSLPCLPLARRVILSASSTECHPDSAQASTTALTSLLSALSSLVGQAGSAVVLRRSLRLTESAYPWLEELRRVGPADDLTAALAVSMSQQSQDVAQAALIAVVASLLELFVTLIGERLVMQLLEETWPDVFPSSS